MVERVQSFEPELQHLAFGDKEVLVQTQVGVEVLRPSHVADRARSERVRGRTENVGRVGINILNVRWSASGVGETTRDGWNQLVLDVNRTITTWSFRQSLGANSICKGIIGLEITPATELIQGQRVSGVGGHNGANLPISDDRIERGIHVLAELFAASDRERVGHVTGQDVLLVEETRPPIRTRVVDVLRPRLPT